MNDFTKEELEIIIESIHILDGFLSERDLSPTDLLLQKKIQSMIDDYDKHDVVQVKNPKTDRYVGVPIGRRKP